MGRLSIQNVGDLIDALSKLDPKMRVFAYVEQGGDEGPTPRAMEIDGVDTQSAVVSREGDGSLGVSFDNEAGTKYAFVNLIAPL